MGSADVLLGVTLQRTIILSRDEYRVLQCHVTKNKLVKLWDLIRYLKRLVINQYPSDIWVWDIGPVML